MAKVHNYLQHESLFRGEGVLQQRRDAKILLCGAGALGSWLTDLLARQGYWGLTLLDKEKVDDENFGTQNYGRPDAGRFKATQAACNIYRRIGVPINNVAKKLTADNASGLIAGHSLVVDLFDNSPSRAAVHEVCLKKNVDCVHAGLAAMGFFQVRWNEEYIVPAPRNEDADTPCEYPLAANLVTMCVAATAEVINRYIDDGQKLNVEFWLKAMSLETE
jgi:molybdopterin/thiamine biosynthesis adenylyltransferase